LGQTIRCENSTQREKPFRLFLFAMLMGEAHEISHFIVGKLIGGLPD
jgi:hypothetical protein